MQDCNCLIGYFHSYDQSDLNDLRLDTYVESCVESAERANWINSQLYPKRRKIHPKDYLDNRKRMTTLYNYCPDCGKKNDFKKLRSQF